MLCRTARSALIDRQLETSGPERAAALERHLERCADCAREARAAARIADDLALLREEIPFEIDVRSRVLAHVIAVGRPAPDELSLRQWVLTAAAAIVAALVIGGGVWDLLPRLAEPARQALGLASAAPGVAAGLAAPLAGLATIPFKLLGSLAATLHSLAPLFERLLPVATSLAGLAMVAMAATVVYFVGRDLRAGQFQPRL